MGYRILFIISERNIIEKQKCPKGWENNVRNYLILWNVKSIEYAIHNKANLSECNRFLNYLREQNYFSGTSH